MTRLSLKLMLLLWVPCILLIGFALAMGSTQPMHSALRGFVEGCEGVSQACWRGIVLEQTTVQAANDILLGLGYRGEYAPDIPSVSYLNPADATCNVRVQSSRRTVQVLTFEFCGSLRAGDFVELFDTPPASITINCSGEAVMRQGYWVLFMEHSGVASRITRLLLNSFEISGSSASWRGFGYPYPQFDARCS